MCDNIESERDKQETWSHLNESFCSTTQETSLAKERMLSTRKQIQVQTNRTKQIKTKVGQYKIRTRR